MKVIKFGGAVLKDAFGFSKMADILQNYNEQKILVVISALDKTTAELQKSAKTAQSGNENLALNLISQIIKKHKVFSKELVKSKQNFDSIQIDLLSIENRLINYIRGICLTRELSPRILDVVLSYGELLALKIIEAFLMECGFVFSTVDSSQIIVTDSSFGSANHLQNETMKNIEEHVLPVFSKSNLALTQGFVARNIKGDITTMGIESSNLTAAIYSAYLKADELIIWTDVEGIRSADPKIVQDSKSIPFLNFREALSLSNDGLKLIYPSMIKIAEENNFDIVFRSAFNPDGEFTIISNKNDSAGHLVITGKSGLIYYSFANNSEDELLDFCGTTGIQYFSFDANISEVLISDNNILGELLKEKGWNFAENYSVITVHNFNRLNEIIQVFNDYEFSNKYKFSYSEYQNTLKIVVSDSDLNALINALHWKLI